MKCSEEALRNSKFAFEGGSLPTLGENLAVRGSVKSRKYCEIRTIGRPLRKVFQDGDG